MGENSINVKGKYVAQIEMNFSFTENMTGVASFAEIKERLNTEMDEGIKRLLSDEFGDLTSSISVMCLYRDMWKETADNETD